MIRRALGLTQGQMAFRMTEQARAFGLDAFYETPIISRIETGERKLALVDGVVLASMDPERRGVFWLATGELRHAAAGEGGDPQTRTAFPIAPRGIPSERVEPAPSPAKKRGDRA